MAMDQHVQLLIDHTSYIAKGSTCKLSRHAYRHYMIISYRAYFAFIPHPSNPGVKQALFFYFMLRVWGKCMQVRRCMQTALALGSNYHPGPGSSALSSVLFGYLVLGLSLQTTERGHLTLTLICFQCARTLPRFGRNPHFQQTSPGQDPALTLPMLSFPYFSFELLSQIIKAVL